MSKDSNSSACNPMITEEQRARRAHSVTMFGFLVNLVLTLVKIAAGVFGRSGAMIADAVHSLSDFATDIIVLVSFGFVRQPPDRDHHYGHGKFETLATLMIGLTLLFVGGGILVSGVKSMYEVLVNGHQLESPEPIALAAAAVSIAVKEFLYRLTIAEGKKINSKALIANAWHHRSDAFSSIGAFAGIGGAIAFGDKWALLDPLAAAGVSFFIVKAAYEIIKGSMGELLDASLDEKSENEIIGIIKSIPGVKDPHNLRTRKNGNKIIIDCHIRVQNEMTVFEAHGINCIIEQRIRDHFGEETFINIHTEPEHE